jgi:hypothetical protein
MYGTYKSLLMNPPRIVIFSNQKCDRQALSQDRWKFLSINAKDKDFF